MPLVISVGNIVMGGAGKTPFTIFLARYYLARSFKVAVLSLGYKGKLGYGTHIISDGRDIFYTPPLAADEPYMMACALPGAAVITGKRRTLSYDLAMERFQPDVVILDDGFQHRSMKRDVDILLMDHRNPVSTGFIFPFGYLREMPGAVKRADIIVFTRAVSAEMNPKVEKYCKDKPVFYCNNSYSHLSAMGKSLPLEAVAGKRVWLLSGIANPAQFERQIGMLGCEVVGRRRYRDHHAYTMKDMSAVFATAAKSGAELLLTTEKDYVRIPAACQSAFIYPVLSVNMLNGSIFESIEKMAGL